MHPNQTKNWQLEDHLLLGMASFEVLAVQCYLLGMGKRQVFNGKAPGILHVTSRKDPSF